MALGGPAHRTLGDPPPGRLWGPCRTLHPASCKLGPGEHEVQLKMLLIFFQLLYRFVLIGNARSCTKIIFEIFQNEFPFCKKKNSAFSGLAGLTLFNKNLAKDRKHFKLNVIKVFSVIPRQNTLPLSCGEPVPIQGKL